MREMEHSMAHPFEGSRPVDLPGWKAALSHAAGALLALLFLTSGIWKLTDPFRWTTMVEQLLVPYWLSMPLTLAVGVAETFAGVLILVPRFRRWGSWLVVLLLVGFMVYFAVNYAALTGKDCSCFPWVKRTVGPGFFIGDAVMLLLALVAGLWAVPSRSIRSAAVVLGAIVVFAGVLFGITASRLSGTVVAIPTREQQFAKAFLNDTGLKAGTSLELERLKKVFPFGDPPFGVALENGHEKAPLTRFEGNEPAATLRQLGFIE